MDTSEARKFYVESIFTALPGVESYLNSLDRNGDTERSRATLRIWVDALALCDIDDACVVLQDMVQGREPVPDSWSFGPRFVALCRARSGRRLQAQRDEETRAAIGARPLNVMAACSGHELWNEHWVPMLAAIENGSMSKHEARRQWEQILKDRIPDGGRVTGFV